MVQRAEPWIGPAAAAGFAPRFFDGFFPLVPFLIT
jgi:hypothetical protein